ncbi:hypothetical protein HK407_08g13540 [Ordospora pajunii]|uniref:uncharacterized protein n=1 Tax=Ordospora pajunii TaxID=3039483 RepID=UPI00295274B0|nr:uncharacterized protein HK407_08g13540 [Ordospora pajunii]KAH9411080.1 hypothetical protein HK407_08g13540 [Ordospora pajunii]
MNEIKSRIGSIQNNKYVLMSKMFGKKSNKPITNEEVEEFVFGLLILYMNLWMIPFGIVILTK